MLNLLIVTLLFGAPSMSLTPTDIIKDCPESPNCVSTLTDQQDKLMQPLSWSDNDLDIKAIIKKIITALPRTKIKEESDDFLHVVFTTLIMRFKDDVYFYIDKENKKIHFKSQSRVGYSDMGKNKTRMQELSKAINTKLK